MRRGLHPRTPRARLWTLAAIPVFFLLACQSPPPLPLLHAVPNFELREAPNTSFRRDDLLGRFHIVDFMFTDCPLACPTMTLEMKRLYEEFPTEQLGFISITVDPDTDTFEVLNNYKKKLGVDPSRWKFLRGDVDTVRTVSEQGFWQAASELPYGHSLRFILVDQDANIRGFYQSDDADHLAQLRRDLANIL